MKQIKIGDTVYYKNDFDSAHKAKVLQLFTNYDYNGKPYPAALIITTEDKAVRHIIVELRYLTHNSTEYDKQKKRNKIKKQIDQLQRELKEL